MIKKTITLELFDLQTKNSELPLKEKLLNQVKEDEETIEKVNKNNIAFAKGIMPLFFNYIKILSEKIDPDLNKKRIYFKFKNEELIVDLFTMGIEDLDIYRSTYSLHLPVNIEKIKLNNGYVSSYYGDNFKISDLILKRTTSKTGTQTISLERLEELYKENFLYGNRGIRGIKFFKTDI